MNVPPQPPPPPPPPSGPPYGGPPPGSGRTKMLWPLLAALAAVFVVIALVVGFLVFKGDGDKEGEVFLEPVASEGIFPWTASVVPPGAPTTVPLPPPTAPPPPPASGQTRMVAVTGDRTGIYGGTLELSVCDKPKLISFLEQNPSQRSAWAGVLGVTDVRSYVDSLTPVILSADTRVTNHGFRDGRPLPVQSVLQAGTAVLVDQYGVPRVRCYCGNPLLAPVLSSSTPIYTGQRWPGFDPGRVIVVQAAPAPVTQITTININNGGPLVIPAGGTYPPPQQQPLPPPQQPRLPQQPLPPPQQPRLPQQPVPPPQQPRVPQPPQQQPQPPAAQVLRLTSITVTRSYGGSLTLGGTNAVQPGTSTAGAGERQFQIGWDYDWTSAGQTVPRGTAGANRNRAVGTVTLTQVPATITVGQPAALAATMSGEWFSSGYGVDRDRTLSLSGATGSNSQNFGGPPSGSVQGTIQASGTTQPAATGSGVALSTSAVIRFGEDHTGEVLIQLNYQ